MSKVDITLSIIVLVGAYGGYRDGFLLELFSLFAILLGVLLGFKLMGYAMLALEQRFNIDQKALPYISFAFIFFLVVFLVNIIAKLMNQSLQKPLLGVLDGLAGAVIGFARTAFMLSVLLWIFDSLKFHFPRGWADDSWLLPMIASVAPTTAHTLGSVIPFFENVL